MGNRWLHKKWHSAVIKTKFLKQQTHMTKNMKIVVIGGSGLIGTKLVNNLQQHGHDAVAASRSSGINAITGEGVAEALAGAQVVVDVANSPSFEDKAVLEFFETSGRNLLAAEVAAGVGITSPCLSSAPIAFLGAVTSARKWPKKT